MPSSRSRPRRTAVGSTASTPALKAMSPTWAAAEAAATSGGTVALLVTVAMANRAQAARTTSMPTSARTSRYAAPGRQRAPAPGGVV